MTSREAVLVGKDAAVRLRGGLIHRLGTTVLSLRGRHLLVLDLLLIAISTLLTLQIRHDGLISLEYIQSLMPAVLLPLVIRPAVNIQSGMYRRLWRHASVHELAQIVLAVVVGSVIAVALAIALALVPGVTSARLPLSND